MRQKNRTKNSEINPRVYGQLIYDKAPKDIHWINDAKKVLWINYAKKIRYHTPKKKKKTTLKTVYTIHKTT